MDPPAFTELDLIQFVLKMHHQPIDPVGLQQMVTNHRPTLPMAQSPSPNTFQPTTASTPATTSQIPEPKVIFNYSPPTPAPTPSPGLPNEEEEVTSPTITSKVNDWCGSSIYNNIPDSCMVEYDKILRESHQIKANVIEKMHVEMPINYDYNPNKSRIRTNYEDCSIAEGRTKNNVASRRSRQRKKFQQQIHQHSVDFDEDENFLLRKQEKWLMAIIENLEEKLIEEKGVEGVKALRQQCGLE